MAFKQSRKANEVWYSTLSGVTSSKIIRTITEKVMYGLSGFLLAGGAVFGQYAPFGCSAVAAAPSKNLFVTCLGTVLGYIVNSQGGSFRYVATVLAVAAIRWTLSDIKRINKSVVYPVLLSFLAMLTTGLVLAVVGGYEPSLFAMCIIEALLSGIGSYFFFKTIAICRSTRGLHTLNQTEIACMVMTGCIFLLAFSVISFGGISSGRIAAVLVIMLCARYGSVGGGSVSGVATGVIFSMANSSFGFLAGAYAFGGLMAGLFAPVGKIATVVIFILCHTVMAFQCSDPHIIISSVYESLIAGAVFMLLPKDLGNKLSAIFTPATDQKRCEGLRQSVIMRLDFAAKALHDVSSSVDRVSNRMKKLYSYDISGVYKLSVTETCSHCGLRAYCWQNQRSSSIADFNSLTPALTKKGKIDEKDFSKNFAKKCCKAGEMAVAINRNYDNYVSYLAAERRVGEIRGVVAGQFCGLGDILGEMAQEFDDYERFDTSAAQKISTAVKMQGLIPLDVSCRTDRFGRMTVEIETADTDSSTVKKGAFTKEITKACGRIMDAPCISYAPNRCRIQLCERALFDVQIGSAQHISGNGKLCGDSYNYFADGMGRMVTIISDGMGTGGRAAVDGSMAENIMTKLIKAGLGFDCALKVVNSALLVKSGDESLATLDIVVIDLFSGSTEIMKAGAPLTFLRRGSNVERVDFSSLPTGILTEVKLSHQTTQLSRGDWVVMVSDGALSTGDQWIENIIENWTDGCAQELAKKIEEEAKDRRTDGYDDDITVIAMCVMNNIIRR